VTNDFTRGSEGFEPPKYLTSLIAAVNDGAKAAQAGALAFALVGVYLLATAFSATDEDLLRGRAVTISQIGATLPPSFSFAIAPFVFVFVHIYTLARYDMLSSNVRQFLSELQQSVLWEADRERCRQLLANVEFIQALVAPRASRLYSWVWRWLVRGIIAIFPVSVLILVQINALRYQSELITWVQRAWLFADLGALIWFFYRNPLRAAASRRERIAGSRRWAVALWLGVIAACALVCRNALERVGPLAARIRPSLGRWARPVWARMAAVRGFADRSILRWSGLHTERVCTSMRRSARLLWLRVAALGRFVYRDAGLQGESIGARTEKWTHLLWMPAAIIVLNLLYLNVVPADADPFLVRYEESAIHFGRWSLPERIHRYLADAWRQPVDVLLCSPLGWGCRYLRVNNRTLVDRTWDKKEIVDLRSGAFDPRKIESAIDGLVLRNRSFRFAIFENSWLLAVDLTGADLRGADLEYANLSEAQLDRAQLTGTRLVTAHLQNASLVGVQLQGALLEGAQLQGANLYRAELQGANLSYAQLEGAALDRARLQCATLVGAQLQGASLSVAELQGADLSGAQLQGTILNGARLWQAQLDSKTDLGLSNMTKVDFAGPLAPEQIKALHASLDSIPDFDLEERNEGEKRCRPVFAPGETSTQIQFRASSDRPVLIDNPKNPVFEKIPDEWLITTPTPSYASSLVTFLTDELASGDSAIALGIANRVYVEAPNGSFEHELHLNLACQLLMGVKTKKISLPPENIVSLSSILRVEKRKCEPAETSALRSPS
jgi:uncharacterized protein YjbI with pentapeptide repeats